MFRFQTGSLSAPRTQKSTMTRMFHAPRSYAAIDHATQSYNNYAFAFLVPINISWVTPEWSQLSRYYLHVAHCTLAAEAGPVCAHVHQAAERGQGEGDLHLQLQLWLLSRDRDCRGRRKVKVIDLIPLILYLLYGNCTSLCYPYCTYRY